MAVSATWIKNNMLFSCEHQERQLTEAELKVQRSLQKLSIPDWYLNKRSNPPKILNVTPIECRTPSWKTCVTPKNTSLNSTSFSLSDTLPLEDKNVKPKVSSSEETPSKPACQHKSPETRRKRTTAKAPSVEEEIFDTSVPRVKLPKKISKTFPKMSPSRKIRNINLVFPPGPKIELSSDIENGPRIEESKYKTMVLKKHVTTDADRTEDNDISERDGCQKTGEKRNDDTSYIVSSPVTTPNAKASYKARATSTPKFSPANLFSSTIKEETPRRKKTPSQSILEKSSIFESSSKSQNLSHSCVEKSSTAPRRKLSQSLLEKTSIFESSRNMEPICRSFEETPVKVNKINLLLKGNIRSIEPILFEKDDTSVSPASSYAVRDIVRRIEVTNEKKRTGAEANSKTAIQEKLDLNKKQRAFFIQKKTSTQTESPCSKFLTSKRKSTELENVVKSKQTSRANSVVRSIIETLTERISKSPLSHQTQASESSPHNFVRQVVDALEKGEVPTVEDLDGAKTPAHEEDSSSESEAKSCTTSASVKDTDSSSDCDRRSPIFKSDNDQRFDYSPQDTEEMVKLQLKAHQEDDSVYWIPVSRCKLPRTSSLLSMMSRLSANTQSPCVSPIRSESETENADWGATYKKPLSRKLFRIDETTVIDSGYSDKSDRSGMSSGCCMVDSTWSEDTQNDSGPEVRFTKATKKSSRRKSIVGHAFYVH